MPGVSPQFVYQQSQCGLASDCFDALAHHFRAAPLMAADREVICRFAHSRLRAINELLSPQAAFVSDVFEPGNGANAGSLAATIMRLIVIRPSHARLPKAHSKNVPINLPKSR
jgi:hypothetical protein